MGLIIAAILYMVSACHSPPREKETLAYTGDQLVDEEENPELALLPDSFSPSPESPVPLPVSSPVSSFSEVWAYLVKGREAALSPGLPLSDIGYFNVDVDSYGKLGRIPNPKDAPSFPARFHLVASCDSYALTHFVLMEGSRERRELIADLIAAAKDFDGLQIDFELIPSRDGKTNTGGQALPARWLP